MDDNLLNKNKNINRGFRSLDVWKESVELFAVVKTKIDELKTISFKVKAQIEDSAYSVSSNIAEGYCRRHLKENIQFLNIALASLGENYSQLFTLTNSGIVESTWFEEFDKIHYQLENKLIKMNKSYVEKLKNKENWNGDYVVRELIENYDSK